MLPYIIAAVVIILPMLMIVFWGIGVYNKLIRLRNAFKNAFAQIDVQLKRRHDLIPNLVETAKGYLKHERETLEGVIAARSGAVSAREGVAQNPGDPTAMKQLGKAEAGLGGALGRLFALQESYPDLKADTSMNNLMGELTETENNLAGYRQSFNNHVMVYNNAREVFPANTVAGMFKFEAAAPFEIENEAEKEAPKVSF